MVSHLLSNSETKYSLNRARITAFDCFFNPFKANFHNIKIAIVGSIRRKSPEVGDIDIIIASQEKEIINWSHNQLAEAPTLLFINTKRINGTLENIPTQVWFCKEEDWGPSLLMRTGPREFNVKLSIIAKRKGLHYSENGLCKRNPNGSPGERIDNNTESDIISIILNRNWIPPEERGI